MLIEGLIKGSIVHVHRARTVLVQQSGTISSSEMGICFVPSMIVFHLKCFLNPYPRLQFAAHLQFKKIEII